MSLLVFNFILVILLPIIWFLNLVKLLENINKGKSIHNQKILGCVWSASIFILIYILLLSIE